jgi:transcriptional regulator with XRE-family HTH domain
MKDVKKLLGNRIKVLRKQRNLTQEKLAELVDKSKNHISKIEQGTTNPPLSLLIDIAEKLDVELSELFNFNTKSTKIVTLKKKFSEINNEKILKLLYQFYNAMVSESVK